jgi:hypothetical protein
MGRNLMRRKGRHDVIVTARRTVAEQLRAPAVAELLIGPAAGAHRTRSPGRTAIPSTWPAIGPAARAA